MCCYSETGGTEESGITMKLKLDNLSSLSHDGATSNVMKKIQRGALMEERKKYLAKRGDKIWEVAVDSNGHVYFKNKVTGESSWEMPLELDSFGSLKALQYFNINMNKVTKLPSSIGKCLHLTTIKVEMNLLTTLPDSFGDLVNLTSCDLNQNKFEALPETLGKCKALTRLKLNSNRLAFLSVCICKLVNLESLWLAGNSITLLPPGKDRHI